MILEVITDPSLPGSPGALGLRRMFDLTQVQIAEHPTSGRAVVYSPASISAGSASLYTFQTYEDYDTVQTRALTLSSTNVIAVADSTDIALALAAQTADTGP